MKSDWLPGFAQKTLLIVLGLIGGMCFAFMLEVGYPIRADAQPEWCSSIGPLCWAYEWQTLIAGVLAVLAAFFTVREARRQYMLSRWETHKSVAEDYKLMQGLALKIDGMLERGRETLELLKGDLPKAHIRANSIGRLDLELESNIRKEFNPFFFDAYVNLAKRMTEFNERVQKTDTNGFVRVGAVRKEYEAIVTELQFLHDEAMSAEREGKSFVQRVNRAYPRDMHLSLNLKLRP